MGMSAILSIFCAALAQDDASHFPLIPESRWVYKTREHRWSTKVGEPGPEKDGLPRTVLCQDGKESPTLRTSDGTSASAVRVMVTRDGVYQNSVDPANLILKFPLKKFDDWGAGDRKNGLSRFANHGQHDLEIGGTRYRCWKITEQRAVSRGLRTWTRWYAPGVGLVCEEFTEETDGIVVKRSALLDSYEKEGGRK